MRWLLRSLSCAACSPSSPPAPPLYLITVSSLCLISLTVITVSRIHRPHTSTCVCVCACVCVCVCVCVAAGVAASARSPTKKEDGAGGSRGGDSHRIRDSERIWRKECGRALLRLWRHKASWPFMEPVDPVALGLSAPSISLSAYAHADAC